MVQERLEDGRCADGGSRDDPDDGDRLHPLQVVLGRPMGKRDRTATLEIMRPAVFALAACIGVTLTASSVVHGDGARPIHFRVSFETGPRRAPRA